MSKKHNLRHEMLRLARGIANKEVKNEMEREVLIKKTLDLHPEFDYSEFKKMVREAKQNQILSEEQI